MANDIQTTSKPSVKDQQSWRQSIFRGLNRKLLWVMRTYIVLAGFEMLIFPSLEVAFALVVSYVGIFLTRYTLCRSSKLLYYPVSTLALLFYCLFFDILPLPATLLEFKPLTYNIRIPYWTFIYLLYLQLIMLGVHSVYTRYTQRKNVLRTWLNKFNFFQPLTSQEVWFLIFGSFFWYSFIMITRGLYLEENINVNAQFGVVEWAINLFFSGFYQVVFIFYFRKINNIKGQYQIRHVLIALVALAIFVIGIGTNMRTAAITVFANAFFSLALYVIYYPSVLTNLMKPKYYLLVALLGLFFVGPFQSLSKSMVAVRYDRAGKNALEILEMTLNNEVKVDESAELVKKQTSYMEWDERYLSSDLLNRFCSLKIQDETLYHARRLGSDERRIMRLALYSKLMDQLPGVVKKRLGMAVTYDERQFSLSDLLFHLSSERRYVLGGIRIGSLQGLGFALFGHWFPLILIPLYFIMFYLMDSVVMVRGSQLVFPLFFFAGMMEYIAIFSDRHFYLFEFRYIFRGYWETVIAYIICINIVKRLPLLRH